MSIASRLSKILSKPTQTAAAPDLSQVQQALKDDSNLADTTVNSRDLHRAGNLAPSAYFEQVKFEGNFSKQMDVDLSRAKFQHWVDFSGADLSGQVLGDKNFKRGYLDLAFVKAEGTNFDGADLTLRQKPPQDWQNAYVNPDTFTIAGASFKKAKLDLDLSQHNAARAQFNEAEFKAGSVLRESNLQGASFSDAKAPGINFENSNLEGADLSGAFMPDANFSGVKLDGATLTGANLTGADFTGASLKGVDFRNAALTGADFTGATLDNYTQMTLSSVLDGGGHGLHAPAPDVAKPPPEPRVDSLPNAGKVGVVNLSQPRAVSGVGAKVLTP